MVTVFDLAFFHFQRSKKNLLILLICCGFSSFMVAQKGFQLEPVLHFGVVTKHTPELKFKVKSPTVGMDLNFKFKSFGTKEWQEWRKFPTLGVTATWMRFGNTAILGQAFSITPNITLPLFNAKKWEGYFQVGSGIAYMTKTYNAVNNPENNAIGSHGVASMLMRFYAARQIRPRWKMNVGISLNHFSNGGSRLPNFGLNIPALMVGLNYTPQPIEPTDFIFHQKEKTATRKFGLDLHFGSGLVQRFAIGGPRFPVYFVALGGNYYLNRVNRLVAGFEYEQNRAIYFFSLHTFHSFTTADARKKASRLTFFVGDEFLFGRWSITLQMGVYLGKFSFLKSGTFYNKFSTRYYLPQKGVLKQKVFLCFSLKSHLTVAEYFGFGGGINF